MGIDFKSFVNSGNTGITTISSMQRRQIVDLTKAQPSTLWSNYTPSTANKSLKGALTTIKNAPVSSNWWDDLLKGTANVLNKPVAQAVLNTLDAPRNALFTWQNNLMDGKLNWNDLPMAGMTEGLVGSYSPEKKVTTETMLNNFGVHGTDGQLDWTDVASFGGDVLGDPLTYLTFGAGSAAKQIGTVGAKAALEAGLKEGTQAFTEYATKAGQAAAKRQAVGFNIPFGPEVTLAEKKGALKINSQTVGKQPAAELARKIEDLGIIGPQRYDLASKVVGRPIQSFNDLNTQEWDYLNQLANSKQFKTKVQEIMAQAPDPFDAERGIVRLAEGTDVIQPRALPGGASVISHTAEDFGNGVINPGMSRRATESQNVIDTSFSPVNPVQDGLDALAQMSGKGYTYFDGLDGVSQLGKLLKGKPIAEKIGNLFGGRRFVPSEAQLADHRIPQGVNGLEDARLGGYAKARFKVDDMAALANEPEIKNLTPEERQMLPFVIEEKWPKSINPSDIPADSMERMQAAAEKLKLYRDQFTREELNAGVNYIPRDNYFPHINNIPSDPTEFQAFLTQLEHINPDMAAHIKAAPKGFTRERKIFSSMADLRDFMDANAGNAEIQKMFGGAVFDPVEAYAKRAMSGAQEVAKMQGYQVLKDLGIAKKAEPGKVPKGWKVVKMGSEDYAVPQEIEKRLNSLNRILTNDAQLNKVLQKADDIYTIWRRNVTVVNPAFHYRQIIGNIFQNTLAGVTPKAYKLAAKILHGKNDTPLLKYGGQELTGEGIMKMAMEDGVIGTGSSTDYLHSLTKELGQQLDKGNLHQKVNPLSEQFTPGRLGRKASEWEDNMSRLAHYVFILQKGGTRKIARDSVIKHLFDYSNLTKFEKGMRVVFPFYNWMRNNIPFQIAQAAKRPGLYQIINDLQTSAQNTPDTNDLMDQLGLYNPADRQAVEQIIQDNGGVLPDYIRNMYINVGGNNYMNPGLPSSDLASVNPAKLPDTILQSLNPLVPWLTGLSTNRTSLGTPVDMNNPSADRPSFPAALGYTAQQFGGYPGRVATTLGGDVLDALQGNDVNIGQDLMKLFLGVTQVDPVKKLQGLIYERARQITGR